MFGELSISARSFSELKLSQKRQKLTSALDHGSLLTVLDDFRDVDPVYVYIRGLRAIPENFFSVNDNSLYHGKIMIRV